MKSTKRNAVLTALLALFLALTLSPFASALPARHATSSFRAQQQQQQQPQAQQFTGKIMELKSGQLALVTGKTDTGYTGHFLDDQTTAKKFINKDVKVTGTLDSSTNTIHVTHIEGA